MKNGVAIFALAIWVLLAAVSFVIELWPEPPAKILVGAGDWVATEHVGRARLTDFAEQYRQTRSSILAEGEVLRTYTPEANTKAGSITSAPFHPSPFMSIAVVGTSRSATGTVAAYLQCDANSKRLPFFNGSVNVNVAESVVSIGEHWCPGEARVHVDVRSDSDYVGVGTVSRVAAVSWLKRTSLGLFGFFAATIITMFACGLACAALSALWKPEIDAVCAAMVGIGLLSLAVFFAESFFRGAPWGAIVTLLASVTLVVAWLLAKSRLKDVARQLAQPFGLWVGIATGYFLLLTLGYNGLGHWEPNYRFAPAVWSSDNELPWIFAEGLRNGWSIPGLYGSDWTPTDRPPLLVGADLLMSDSIALLQHFNDGRWLRGEAYNGVAIALNSLWVPIFFRAAEQMFDLNPRRALLVTLVAALIPFFIFNSIYGWGKMLGGAYGVAAALVVFQTPKHDAAVISAALFGAIGALSILSHASAAIFILPLGAWFFVARLWRAPVALLVGVGAGGAVLAPWLLYQHFLYPTHDPLMKFALTGDFGFAQPTKSVLESVKDHYAHMTWQKWLQAKAAMFKYLFAADSGGRFPAPIHGYGWMDSLRSADFYRLSAGNLVFVVAPFLLLIPTSSSRAIRGPAAMLLSCVLLVCLIQGAAFFSAMVIHQMPYTLFIALALVGLSAAASLSRAVFFSLAGIIAGYCAVVWIVLPLRSVAYIDVGAAVGLAVLSMTAFAWLSLWKRFEPTSGGEF